jgi:hypothetical protein
MSELRPRDFIESGVIVRGTGAMLLWGFLRDHRDEWDRHTAPAHAEPGLRAELTSLELALEAAAAAHRESISAGVSPSGNRETLAEMNTGKLITTSEAAALLHLSSRRVRQLLTAGLLFGQVVGGRWMVDPASVNTYLQESA